MKTFSILALLLLLTISPATLAAAPIQEKSTRTQIETPVNQSIDTRQDTQLKEEKWRLEKEKLMTRFAQLQQEQQQLKDRQEQLEKRLTTTGDRLSVKKKQLADIEKISQQIHPFLNNLLSRLKSFIDADLPFLVQERKQRIDKLETLLADPDVNVSEKYRKMMEALLVEAEYAITIETYQETISINGERLLANVFRLGRINLFYQSLDHNDVGFFNVATGRWEPLPASHNRAIESAIDVAAKRQPAELLALPLGRMVIQ